MSWSWRLNPHVFPVQCARRFEELKSTGSFPLVDEQCNPLTVGGGSPSDTLSSYIKSSLLELTGDTGDARAIQSTISVSGGHWKGVMKRRHPANGIWGIRDGIFLLFPKYKTFEQQQQQQCSWSYETFVWSVHRAKCDAPWEGVSGWEWERGDLRRGREGERREEVRLSAAGLCQEKKTSTNRVNS